MYKTASLLDFQVFPDYNRFQSPCLNICLGPGADLEIALVGVEDHSLFLVVHLLQLSHGMICTSLRDHDDPSTP